MTLQPRVAFSWNGLPQFAARLFRAAMDRLGRDCVVVGSRPEFPVEGMERVLRCKVHWVDAGKPVTWAELGLQPPDIFFQSGWSYPAFSDLGRQVRAAGGQVICISDANWRGDFRQMVLGPVAFRLLHRQAFAAMLVPGKNGTRLMRYFGMPETRIHRGMLGADPALFNGGPPLPERPKRFLFVGRFDENKNVVGLAEAFVRFSTRTPGWELHIAGTGNLRPLIPRAANIVTHEFVQPEQLGDLFRAARFFVLPSLQEAWGMVVHEAASCGCGLLLSQSVGSGADLATPVNAIRFRPGSVEAIELALTRAAAFDDAALVKAEVVSRELAAAFGPARFADEVVQIVTAISR